MKIKLILLTLLFFVLLIIDIMIPDPLPILDELVLAFATTLSGYFSFKGDE